MKSSGFQYQFLWWAVLVVMMALAYIVFFIIRPGVSGSPFWGAREYLLGGIGLVAGIFGARIARGVLVPGSGIVRIFEKGMIKRGDSAKADARLAGFALGLGLIEFTAVTAVVLFHLSGDFSVYIVMTGIALVGWLVARPAPEDFDAG